MGIAGFFQTIYGLFMGTSVSYMKSKRTHFFPSRIEEKPDGGISIGGARNSGWIIRGDEAVLIDMESTPSAAQGKAISIVRTTERVEIAKPSVEVEQVDDSCWIVRVPSWETIFVGDLFYNKVFPPVPKKSADLIRSRIELSKKLIDQYHSWKVVPAEGTVATVKEWREYLGYLEDLLDPAQEFGPLKQKYIAWSEIIGSTSFSENFDHIRG